MDGKLAGGLVFLAFMVAFGYFYLVVGPFVAVLPPV